MINEFQKEFKRLSDPEKVRAVWSLFPIYGSSHAKELLPYAERTLALARAASTSTELMEMLRMNGTLYFKTGEVKKAIHCFEELVNFSQQYKNKQMLSLSYMNLGSIYIQNKSYSKALDNLHLALKYVDVVPAKLYNSIGVIYLHLREYENAIKYLKKYGAIKKKIKEKEGIARYYSNLGSVYMKTGDFDEALENFSLCQNYCSKEETPFIQNALLHNLAEVHFKKEEYAKAKEFSELALKEAILAKDRFLETETKLQFAEILFANKEETALKHTKEARDLAIEGEFEATLLKIEELFIKIYKERGDLKKALFYSEQLSGKRAKKINQLHHQLGDPKLLTEKKVIEKLEINNRLIEMQNKDLREFAYIVAHDLKTPLREIVSFSDLLLRNNKLEDSNLEYLNFIRKAAYNLHFKLEDLLNFVTLKKNQSSQSFATEQTIKEVIKNFDKKIKDNNIDVQIDELPNLYGNEKQIQICFRHLIENAIKFNGKENPSLHVFASETEQFINIYFKDNGIGIAPNFHDKIFQLFQQLSKQDGEGRGFGLAICRKIVELHGGSMSVESSPNTGTTFSLSLPKK